MGVPVALLMDLLEGLYASPTGSSWEWLICRQGRGILIGFV